jgi:hypothetical protein
VKKLIALFCILFCIALLPLAVSAQEVTPEVTPPVIVDVPPAAWDPVDAGDFTNWLFMVIAGLVTTFATLGISFAAAVSYIVKKLREDAPTHQMIERLWMSVPIRARDTVGNILEGANEAIDLARELTDGDPATPTRGVSAQSPHQFPGIRGKD